MMHITKSFSAIVSLSLALAQGLSVQAAPQEDTGQNIDRKNGFQPFYIGATAGVPSGFSTFSSFAQDGFHAGFAGDVFAGYRFNGILSAEVDLGWGLADMGARSCCSDSYWVGDDWNTYYGSVLGMSGWHRDDVRTAVSNQRYGARMNVDLLGFFAGTKDSGWHLELAPQTFLYGTKSRLIPATGGGTLLSGPARWHFGYGAALQAGYEIARNLRAGLACGLTFLTGQNIDGLGGRGIHGVNAVLDAAVRISWDFPVARRSGASAGAGRPESSRADASTMKPTTEPASSGKTAEDKPEPASETQRQISSNAEQTADSRPEAEGSVKPQPEPSEVQAIPAEEKLAGPVDIYFDKSSWTIGAQQTGKLKEAAAYLAAHPEVGAEVIGWCDKYGTDEVNATISEFRARVVKKWLVKAGIDAARITAGGNGVDTAEKDRSIARRASIIFKISEQ